jgi:hypothetical protein
VRGGSFSALLSFESRSKPRLWGWWKRRITDRDGPTAELLETRGIRVSNDTVARVESGKQVAVV